jgi:hypothetical protein
MNRMLGPCHEFEGKDSVNFSARMGKNGVWPLLTPLRTDRLFLDEFWQKTDTAKLSGSITKMVSTVTVVVPVLPGAFQ